MTDWKAKIEAFLHDPPHKPYGIANHERTIASNRLAFGLGPQAGSDFDHGLDAMAAAADRFVFPNPRTSYDGNPLRTDWREQGMPFIHPFCDTQLKASAFPKTGDVAEDWMSSALSGIVSGSTREDFIRAWRLWPERLAAPQERDGAEHYMPYLVADTRIPDHTIWQHNSLVSALQGCNGKPAFLIFQIGPVQSFIKQARKTIDLWAGSYLLSYLIAHAMEVIIRKYGPDHLIFPQVRGNALIDHLIDDILGNSLDLTEPGLRNRGKNEMLLPTLPNRFLALVPGDDDKIIEDCYTAVEEKWDDICNDVHDFIDQCMGGDFPGWDELWTVQKKQFPRCEHLIQPLLNPQEALTRLYEGCPPHEKEPSSHPVALLKHWAERCIGTDAKTYYDARNYRHRWDAANHKAVITDRSGDDIQEGEVPELVNPGYAWSLSYMMAEWKFGASKAARPFKQTDAFGAGAEKRRQFEIPKDQLDGELEVLGGEKWEEFWEAVAQDKELGGSGQRHFPKGNQRFGLLTVVKRLFAKAHLEKAFGFDVHRDLGKKIKSTYQIATGKKIDIAEDDEEERTAGAGENYYAVLALDGDNMGKWLSGNNAPAVLDHLSGAGIRQFFKGKWKAPPGSDLDAEDVPRALSPSYHAAFSEALANFASYCVAPVLDKFDGQLIYAGGDDVLAMVPAAKALDCAEALQQTFRGLKPNDANSVLYDIFDYNWSEMHKESHPNGFLKLRDSGGGRPTWPMLLPGPRTTVSVGIAIGHIKAPMQDVIQAARDAESAVKNAGRDGFCMTIMKRSGETHSFTAHWPAIDDSEPKRPNLLAVAREIHTCLDYRILSNGFVHKYCQYLAPALRGVGKEHWLPEFDETSIVAAEEFLRITLARQGGQKADPARHNAERIIGHFNLTSGKISPEMFMNFWMGLAFLHRLEKGGVSND
ncbi:MAG: type III-B CRISPR-associated protein Cas10/Cmr2 [Candidatus Pacebacteria bacterium]|nr:type III-B CRISPR-associated protein Cas10/Cmr2 [Candidatus Paceibacterota bacterium]